MPIALLLAALLGLLAPAAARAQIVDVEGRYWFTDLDASTRVESRSLPGTRIDLRQDLRVGDEDLPEVRLTLATSPNSKLRLAYLQGDFEGDTTLDQSLQFSGTTFGAGTSVDTELELYYGRLGWTYQFPLVPGRVTLGPLVELKGLVLDATVRSPGTGLRESALLPMGFPTVGAMLSVRPFGPLELFAEASGMTFGDVGHVVDAEVGLRVIPIRFLTLSAGYRVFDVRIEIDDDLAKLRLTGPFLGASIRF